MAKTNPNSSESHKSSNSREKRQDQEERDLISASSVFAHDISTPLATAKVNIDLILEHMDEIAPYISQLDKVPAHIRTALISAPELISASLAGIQKSLADYKDFLNAKPVNKHSEQVNEIPQVQQKLKILIVDDEQIHHDIADSVLQKLYEVEHALSGTQALRKCQMNDYDIVLMDMQMPNLSGVETTKKLKLTLPEKTKIIGLTSMPVERQKQDLILQGFYDFLDKPLKPGQLEHLLHQK